MEVCTVDKDAEKLKQSEENNRQEQAQAKEQCLTKKPAQLREFAQA